MAPPSVSPVTRISRTLSPVDAPPTGDDWVGLDTAPLPVEAAAAWVVRDSCGAVVTFTGHARDHSEGRPGVHTLVYEAYDEQVAPVLRRICAELRARWPELGRIVLLHRQGELVVGDVAVVVAVSAPHRDVAFAAARHGIDAVKSSAPIWKQEIWDGGRSWGLEAQHVSTAEAG